ncbi:hypothetical protein TNIN_272801 [Trichonephila inaurata madagascariensis]|uniref:Uncharacterized protein n=1 Tax=Trichonephila inaurata madagascariensis TaxID=2747483 RepID=A0A8X7CBR0_9ARAC|nr:hypothetical protein TNIN_272801 [Trichonephila inaurata madagascariensis]
MPGTGRVHPYGAPGGGRAREEELFLARPPGKGERVEGRSGRKRQLFSEGASPLSKGGQESIWKERGGGHERENLNLPNNKFG